MDDDHVYRGGDLTETARLLSERAASRTRAPSPEHPLFRLQRQVGNRVVSGIVESSRLPVRLIPLQRMKVVTAEGEMGKSTHVNEYHFVNLLEIAPFPESGQHVVVLDAFSDFNGLGEAATQNPRRDFDYRGISWGWRHTDSEERLELVPREGPRAVKVTADELYELIRLARGDVDTPSPMLRTSTNAMKVAGALNRLEKGRPGPGSSSSQTTFPFRFLPRELPAPLQYDPGGRSKTGRETDGFVWAPSGSRALLHVHLHYTKEFYKAAGDVDWREVGSATLTTRRHEHYDPGAEAKSPEDRPDLKVLEAVLETVRRTVHQVEVEVEEGEGEGEEEAAVALSPVEKLASDLGTTVANLERVMEEAAWGLEDFQGMLPEQFAATFGTEAHQ